MLQRETTNEGRNGERREGEGKDCKRTSAYAAEAHINYIHCEQGTKTHRIRLECSQTRGRGGERERERGETHGTPAASIACRAPPSLPVLAAPCPLPRPPSAPLRPLAVPEFGQSQAARAARRQRDARHDAGTHLSDGNTGTGETIDAHCPSALPSRSSLPPLCAPRLCLCRRGISPVAGSVGPSAARMAEGTRGKGRRGREVCQLMRSTSARVLLSPSRDAAAALTSAERRPHKHADGRAEQ
jgi:hypothetical protein